MLAAHHRPLEDDRCPVSDQFLSELYRSDSRNIDLLIASIDPAVRAMLALFCYRRAHLSAVGLAVAASCEEQDLVHWGGIGGSALFAASERPVQLVRYSSRPKVSLSNGALYARRFVVDDEPVDDPAEAEKLQSDGDGT